MNILRRLFSGRVLAALMLLALALFAARAAAKPAAPATPARTADRSASYVPGTFTFGNTQPLQPTGPVGLTGFNLEPEIKTDIWGDVYVTAIEGVPGGVDLWKSTNKGGAFTYLGQPDGAQCPVQPNCTNGVGVGGGDDSIDVSNGGYLYISSLWLGDTTLTTSMDGGAGGALPGQAWQINHLSGNPPAEDRQWVAAYGPQTVYLTFTDIATGTLWLDKSTNAGAAFGVPVMITNPTSGPQSAVEGNLVVDQYSGNLYVAFVRSGAENEVYVARSTDGGATWSLNLAYTGPSGTTNVQVFPFTAVDRGGNVHVVFSRCNLTGTSRSNCQIYMVSSPVSGPGGPAAAGNWLDAVRVSDNATGDHTAVMPYVAAGGPGVVDVTWYGSDATSPDGASNWHLYFAQTRNALDATPSFAEQQAISQTVHDQSICFNGLNCDLSGGNRDLAEYYSMTVDPDGNANIAFSDTVNQCGSGCTVQTWYTRQTAGASAYAPPAPPAPVTFGPNLGNASTPTGLPGSNGSAEPSIAVDSHNCIYGSAPGDPDFWASENNGATWRNTTQPLAIGGGDEDVTTIPQQNGARNDALYYADLVLADDEIFKSTDRGVTWSNLTTVYGHLNPSSDRQWISGDRINNGADQVLYETDHELVTEIVRFSASVNDSPWGTTSGETDPELTALTIPNTNPGPVFASKPTHIVYGVFATSSLTTNAQDPPFGKEPNLWEADGAPPAAPGLPPGYFDPVAMKVVMKNHPVFKGVIDSPLNTPAGATTYGSHVAAIFPAGDADLAGNIYVVWTTLSARQNATLPPANTSPATTWDIWFAASHDGGQNFYGPFKVSSGTGTSILPWIAAGDNGRVDIVWYQSSNPTPPLVEDPLSPGQLTGGPNNMPAGSTWNVMFAQSLNANSREPVFTFVQAGDHINHNGSISIGGLTGSSDRSLLDYFEVAIGPDGKANIIYADNGLSSLHISYARQNGGPLALVTPIVTSCTGGATAVTVADFKARAAGHAVRLTWTTATEAGVAGYNVWRATPYSPWKKLNGKLVPVKGNALLGARYELLDRAARHGVTYTYRLEVVRTDGHRAWAGPVTARR